MKKVLLIEDDGVLGQRAENTITSLGFEPIRVIWLKDAEEMIKAGGYEVVVLDACLGGHEPNTLHLIPLIRATGFQGPIIANSNTHNEVLKKAGCTHVNEDMKPCLQDVFCEAGLI
jgi:DNA-binding response OmpR family regulator